MVGNAWKYRPERQARLQANMRDPEYMRRKEMYRNANGKLAKLRIARWNVAWNIAGRPADFLDFPQWSVANPPDAYETMWAQAEKEKRKTKRHCAAEDRANG